MYYIRLDIAEPAACSVLYLQVCIAINSDDEATVKYINSLSFVKKDQNQLHAEFKPIRVTEILPITNRARCE